MEAIRIKNFRSLRDTGEIALKPITLLLGRNSSGKSTFLRTIPLWKQSLESRSVNPILWYGDYVDFGSVSSAVNRDQPDEPIEFKFDLKIQILEGQKSSCLSICGISCLSKAQNCTYLILPSFQSCRKRVLSP